MTREELYGLLEKGPVFLDGATGSNLQKAGMPTGVCPEQWILDHPDVIVDLQKRYIEAGTQILYAPTFSGNRIKLEEYGLADKIVEINTKLVQLCKEAAGDKGLVCADMTMTGESLEPMGDLELEELIDIYKEQAKILYEAGVDLFVVETMMSLAETRAAVLAIKETCDLPVMVSMTFDEKGKTLYGNTPEGCMVVLQSLGADIVGINCSTGPEKMAEMVRQMKKYANVPILAKPNAGLPQMVDGETVYDMGPEEFASFGPMLMEAGASVLGGCCGTTPEHIARLVETTKDIVPVPVMKEHKRVLASERALQEIDINGPFLVIGERINPTGKKALQESLRQGSMDVVCDMAEEQEEMGAHILDINMGMNGIDEKAMMLEAIQEVTMTTTLPLCIDSSHVDIIEAALRHYPGRALINSISLEKEKFEKLLPIAKKYGAMFILLPLSDAGLPKDIDEKKEIIHKILDRALELGMCKEDIVVDGLVATVGANKNAALDTLATIRYCKEELGLATVGGLSNISFGLPNRGYVNAAFVTMALQSGLTMAIANPSSDIMMNLAAASDLLLNKTGADLNYINRMAEFDAKKKTESVKKAETVKQDAKKEATVLAEKKTEETSVAHSAIYKAVLNGSMKNILDEVKAGLVAGMEPGVIVSEELIPAINEVGDLFEQQKYFLPQLIASAETMKKAIEYLEPMLSSGDETGPKVTIVIATVEGDIHDIGKNLVALMLRNYGYEVIDLGKDVQADKIIAAAKEHNASIIVLSALMTTTMMRMKDTIALKQKENLNVKVMIGGAVTTQSFADEIGADGYSKDAADAVRLAKKLLSE